VPTPEVEGIREERQQQTLQPLLDALAAEQTQQPPVQLPAPPIQLP
jgi:hypothetical protein